MSAKSHLEETFAWWLKLEGIPEPVRQLRFHRPRRWQFDFAWPAAKVAVEVEGTTYGAGGRHQRTQGFEDDCAKYETALMDGWTVYRVPGGWISRGSRLILRPQVIVVLRSLLTR